MLAVFLPPPPLSEWVSEWGGEGGNDINIQIFYSDKKSYFLEQEILLPGAHKYKYKY